METPELVSSAALTSRAWYSASISEFLQTSPDTIVGRLTQNSGFSLPSTQTDAWLAQIALLREALSGSTGAVFLEFNIPRMGRRIDAVLLIGPVVFVVEFKIGDSVFEHVAVDQVWDYALDLKNFHEASHSVSIVPILIATQAKMSGLLDLHANEDGVYRPGTLNPGRFLGSNRSGTDGDLGSKRLSGRTHPRSARNGYFLPPGDASDPTRSPDFYDPTFKTVGCSRAVKLPSILVSV